MMRRDENNDLGPCSMKCLLHHPTLARLLMRLGFSVGGGGGNVLSCSYTDRSALDAQPTWSLSQDAGVCALKAALKASQSILGHPSQSFWPWSPLLGAPSSILKAEREGHRTLFLLRVPQMQRPTLLKVWSYQWTLDVKPMALSVFSYVPFCGGNGK